METLGSIMWVLLISQFVLKYLNQKVTITLEKYSTSHPIVNSSLLLAHLSEAIMCTQC